MEARDKIKRFDYMNILAFDTATEYLGIALANKEDNIIITANIGLRHGESLLPWIDILCQEIKLNPLELNLIVCAIGPGSFTGLRIGLSTAKGIASAAGCPLIGISNMDAIAYRFRFFDGIVTPIIDARKKRFYCAFYEKGKRISNYLDIDPVHLANLLKKYPKVLLTGPHAAFFLKKIANNYLQEIEQLESAISVTEPSTLLELGHLTFKKQGPDPDTLKPMYIRKSEAEILKGH